MRSLRLPPAACFLALALAPLVSAAQERYTLDAWHEVLSGMEAQWRAEDPDYQAVVVAAGKVLCHHHTFRERPEYAPYRAFMQGPGKPMLERFAREKELAEADLRYTYVIAASYLKEGIAPKQQKPTTPVQLYRAEVKQLGHDLIERSFTQGNAFTSAEVHALRLYRIALEQEGVPGGYRNLIDQYARGWKLPMAERVPPLRLPTVEAVFADSPDYVDTIDRGYLTSRYLTADGLMEFPIFFGPYKLGEEGQPVPAVAEPWAHWLKPRHFADLHERVQQRPALILFADPVDSFHSDIWYGLSPYPLMLGERMDLFAVAITIHDTHMPYTDWFSDEWDFAMVHPVSIEERARSIRSVMMSRPDLRLDWLLDGPLRTVQNNWGGRPGGRGTVALVDRQGTLVVDQWIRPYPDEGDLRTGVSISSGRTTLALSQLNRMLFYDRAIHHLLSEEGVASGALTESLAQRPLTTAPIKHRKLQEASFDASTRTLRGMSRSLDHQGNRGPVQAMAFRITPETRVRASDGQVGHGIEAVRALGPGDYEVYARDLDDAVPTAFSVRANGYGSRGVWLSGKVRGYDAGEGQLTVVLDPPGETPGLRYWRENAERTREPNATRFGNVPSFLTLLKSLNQASEAERTVRLPSDAATFAFLNGDPAQPSALPVGAPVALGFASPAEAPFPAPEGVLYPLWIRALTLPN